MNGYGTLVDLYPNFDLIHLILRTIGISKIARNLRNRLLWDFSASIGEGGFIVQSNCVKQAERGCGKTRGQILPSFF